MSASGRYRARQGRLSKELFFSKVEKRYNDHLAKRDTSLSNRERVRARDVWKRDLTGRANGTIDPWYGCDVYDEMLDYAINFTFPWCTFLACLTWLSLMYAIALSKQSGGTFDVSSLLLFTTVLIAVIGIQHPRCLEPRSTHGWVSFPE